MRSHLLVGLSTLGLALTGAAVLTPAEASVPQAAAPDGPGTKTVWTEANKAGFGTARTRGSNVWFTLQRGRVSEVFYPDLSTPSVRNLELVVTDGRTFTDRASRDMRLRTSRPDARSLRFTQVATDKGGHYRLVTRTVTDPRRDAVTTRVSLRSLDGRAYRLYAVVDPALGNDGSHDTGRTVDHSLTATNGSLASALASRPGFSQTSTGFVGSTSDPVRDLEANHGLTRRYPSAGPGNVVQAGRVSGVTGKRGHRSATLTLGLGGDVTAARTATDGPLVRRHRRSVRRRLAPLRRRPAERAGQCEQRAPAVPRLRAGAGGRRGQAAPRCVRGLAQRAVGVGRQHRRAVVAVGCLPRGLVTRRLRVRHRAVGRRRPGRCPSHRRLAVHDAAEARRVVPAELRRQRNPGVDQPAARRGRAADRAGEAHRARPVPRPTRT